MISMRDPANYLVPTGTAFSVELFYNSNNVITERKVTKFAEMRDRNQFISTVNTTVYTCSFVSCFGKLRSVSPVLRVCVRGVRVLQRCYQAREGVHVELSQHPYLCFCVWLQVALGDSNELLDADYKANNLPDGKHSTKGLGQTGPDPKNSLTLWVYRTLADQFNRKSMVSDVLFFTHENICAGGLLVFSRSGYSYQGSPNPWASLVPGRTERINKYTRCDVSPIRPHRNEKEN